MGSACCALRSRERHPCRDRKRLRECSCKGGHLQQCSTPPGPTSTSSDETSMARALLSGRTTAPVGRTDPHSIRERLCPSSREPSGTSPQRDDRARGHRSTVRQRRTERRPCRSSPLVVHKAANSAGTGFNALHERQVGAHADAKHIRVGELLARCWQAWRAAAFYRGSSKLGNLREHQIDRAGE